MKQITNRTLEFNADAFIIPNSFSTKCGEFGRFDYFKQIYDANDFGEIKPDDGLVQLWYVVPDLESENFIDHSGKCLDEMGNKIHIRPRIDILPASIFAEYKEGDVIDINVPYTYNYEDDMISDIREYMLKMHVKLNQSDYRYRRFGKFEEVLPKVARIAR